MKKANLKFIYSVLKVYVFIGVLVSIVGILVMQTQISVLNQELNNNKEQLNSLQANNSYLEMQKNERLTREKISVFADQNGLVTSFPNVVDLPDEETSEE